MTIEEAIRENAKTYKGGYFVDMKDGTRCYAHTMEGLIKATFACMMLHGSEVKANSCHENKDIKWI